MPDTQASTELKLFIDNDGDLYRRITTSILKNLAAKKARGVYRHDLAVKLFGYLTEAGAKKYAQEFGSGPWHKMFDVSTRKLAAKELTKDFEEVYADGGYDSLLPKKCQKTNPSTAHARKKSGAPVGQPRADFVPKKSDRVEILESGGSTYFKPGQFGYVVGESSRGGMHTLDRGDSRQGDLTYLVSKSKGIGGGAFWFSPNALRFTGRGGGGAVSGSTTKNRSQIAREVEAVVGKVPSYRGR